MDVHVTNVKELYAAVNDINNAGNKIILALGIYPLNPAVDNRNAGRLELQENMELKGQKDHPEQAVIDITALPDASFVPGGGGPPRTGALRLGRGSNKLSWLTVMGNNDNTKRAALSVIDTDLGPGNPIIKISNCIVTGGRIGIDVRNIGTAHNGRNIVVELSNNIIRQNLVSDPGTQQGQGIILQHANGVSNATITATLKGNHIFGNTIGLRIWNNSNAVNSDTNNNTTTVTSEKDVIDKNNLGIYFAGGLHNGGGRNIGGNTISFDATLTTIKDNVGLHPDPIVLPSGIFVAGGIAGAGTETSNNRVNIKLTDCTLAGNQGVDIMAFGAFTRTNLPVAQPPNPASFPGKHNIARIHRIGISTASTKMQTDCFPPEAPPTNRVGIVP